MAQTHRQMLYTARHAITGKLTDIKQNAPGLSAGDLAYLDPERPHDVQIRPMLAGERPENAVGKYPPGAMWLVWKSRAGQEIRAVVSLPAPYRKNIRSNVARAIAKTAKFSPAHGKLFALAHAGADPFADLCAIIEAD